MNIFQFLYNKYGSVEFATLILLAINEYFWVFPTHVCALLLDGSQVFYRPKSFESA